jgi:hypothetical protein
MAFYWIFRILDLGRSFVAVCVSVFALFFYSFFLFVSAFIFSRTFSFFFMARRYLPRYHIGVLQTVILRTATPKQTHTYSSHHHGGS